MFAFKSRPVRNWKILESSEMRIVMRRVTSIKDITGNNSHLRKARQTVEMPGQVVQFCVFMYTGTRLTLGCLQFHQSGAMIVSATGSHIGLVFWTHLSMNH